MLSPQRRAIDSALQSMESRSSVRQDNTRHMARPGGSSKWNLARLALAGPASDEDGNLTEIQKILKKVKGEYTTVAQKEDVLEAIMAGAAHASYECLGRYEMDPAYTTRTAINTAAMKGKMGEIYRTCSKIGQKDLDGLHEEDDRLVQKHGLTAFSAQAGESSFINPAWLEGLQCSLGLALPWQRKLGKKATFTKALSGIMTKNNMKVSGALAQAAAGDLLPERGFLGRCGEWCLVGMVNCQGSPKVAGQLAVLVAQELPKAVFQSPSFVWDDAVAGITEAFAKVHTLAASSLDVTLTGASVTVLLFNNEHVWVANVGDCRCVMAVPDADGSARDFHVMPHALTMEHKLCVKKEFDRVKEAGADVRKLVHDKVCRLFVGETCYPSLALTRGIGHRLGHSVGVLHKPTIRKLARKDLDPNSFFLLASAGLWATISESTAVNWASRSFDDPQEAAMSLAQEALARWQGPSSLAKGNLSESLSESFGTFMIRLSPEEPPQQKARTFVPGPGIRSKKWPEVKAPERRQELRGIMSYATPREGLAWRVSPK